MTLLSGTLLDVPVFERFPENAQRALDLVFDECERAPAVSRPSRCSAPTGPPLVELGERALRVVHGRPVAERRRGQPRLELGRLEMHDLLFVATTHTRIPLLVHTLGATEDRVAALLAVTQAYPESSDTGSSEQQMLPYAMRCNEAWARDDPSKLVGTDSFEYGRDLSGAQWWQEICTFIPKAGEAAATGELDEIRRARPRPQRRGRPSGPAGQHGGSPGDLAEQPRC